MSDLPFVANLFLIVSVSIGTIYIGSHIEIIEESEKLENQRGNHAVQHTVTTFQALTYPIYASISLLTLFFFFDYIQLILVAFIVFSCWYSVYIVCVHLYNGLPNFACCSSHIFGLFISSAITLEWLRSGNILLHDILGCALCILFISVLRFPSLKIAAIMLGLLLVYDAFWVFFSEYIFEKNVMVEVATKNASNPIQNVGEYLDIAPLKHATSTINLPIKLIFPNFFNPEARAMMLGLGDIALPGALVAFAKRCDDVLDGDVKKTDIEAPINRFTNSPKTARLFEYTLFGYIIGLFLAFLGSYFSGHAQPALIYIVPAIFFFISLRSYQIGRFSEVWIGLYKSNDN